MPIEKHLKKRNLSDDKQSRQKMNDNTNLSEGMVGDREGVNTPVSSALLPERKSLSHTKQNKRRSRSR